MALYHHTEVDIQPFRNHLDRTAIRKRLLLYFANEEPGTGKLEKTSRYRYCVETMEDGSTIWIVRPGRRNGNDFRIEVEGHRFGKSKTPKYEDVYRDLELKREANPKQFQKFLEFVDAVYACREFKEKRLQTLCAKFAGVGYPADLIIRLIKWFLIEQDMTYWNSSGRDCAFYHKLPR
ncbi:hypothetical protein NZD89_00890 [Alicyclobacillus fastidiosus]|uniref:Uncharacterized protein n=1 Tax=Alicyclobacillus fastidiosus TaxID=392011 RepID=A0ABY6ZHL6_9BACL|nr:hypothetical protein [Alicyclobacillus fastidiosus]WAH42108.1 hypothetical protein NZD89_00890 [Alicyclobacillus fastidiosus]